VQRAISIAQTKGARRAVMLPVSAPFHCALMAPAAEAMRAALAGAAISAPVIPVVANIEAAPITDPEAIRAALVRQVTGTVRWRESAERMAADRVDVFVEVGAGKVLTGLVKRIAAGARSAAFGQPGDLDAVRSLVTA
jgi:[acyl-carrier-protein] S-malonyltransferase